LEIASGFGEAISYFANCYPNVTFIPTDPQKPCIERLRELAATSHENLMPPIELNIFVPSQWERAKTESPYDGIFCFNLIHLIPWYGTHTLLKYASELLEEEKGFLALHGPFLREGMFISRLGVKGLGTGRHGCWGTPFQERGNQGNACRKLDVNLATTIIVAPFEVRYPGESICSIKGLITSNTTFLKNQTGKQCNMQHVTPRGTAWLAALAISGSRLTALALHEYAWYLLRIHWSILGSCGTLQ
jgi:hypothetical protein